MEFWGKKQEGVFLGNNKVEIARMMEVICWGAGWGYILGGHEGADLMPRGV